MWGGLIYRPSWVCRCWVWVVERRIKDGIDVIRFQLFDCKGRWWVPDKSRPIINDGGGDGGRRQRVMMAVVSEHW